MARRSDGSPQKGRLQSFWRWMAVAMTLAPLIGATAGCQRRSQRAWSDVRPGADAGMPAYRKDAGSSTQPGPSCDWLPYGQGLSGGAVYVLAPDPRVDGRLWAALGTYVHRSEDNGLNWVQVSESPFTVRGFAFPSASPSRVIAATGRGLIASADDGRSWSALALDGLDLKRVYAHPADSRTLYASGPRLGILRSLDAGESWSAVNDGVSWAQVSAFSGNPGNSLDVVAGLSTYRGLGQAADPRRGVIVRSLDGGRSWGAVFEGSPINGVSRCRDNPDVLWAGGNEGALLSTDGGRSWDLSESFGPGVNAIAVGGEACRSVIAFVDAGGSQTSLAAGVHVSLDGGGTWHGPRNIGLPASSRPMASGALVLAQPDAMLIFGAKGVHRSTDLAQTWQSVPEIGRLPFRFLKSSDAWPEATWLGTWGNGVWHRPAPSLPWQQVGFDELPEDHIISVTPSASDPDSAWIGGWSDFWQRDDGGYVGSGIRGANVFAVLADGEDRLQMAATQTRGVLVTPDDGQTWTAFNEGLSPWGTLNGFFIDVRAVVHDDVTGQTMIGTEGAGVFELDENDVWQSVSSVATHNSEVKKLIHTEQATVALMANRGIAIAPRGGNHFVAGNEGLSNINLVDIAYEPTGQHLFGVNADGIFVRRLGDPLATWQSFGGDCIPGDPGLLSVLSEGGAEWLVAATSKNRIYRHRVH